MNAQELLNDIEFVTQANKTEIGKIKDRIRKLVAETSIPDRVADSIMKDVSAQLAELVVKVEVTEKAALRIHDEIRNHFAELHVSALQLSGNSNLLPMETSKSGTDYIWSGIDPEIRFEFNLDRSKETGMQIRLFALIKQEYLKQLKVYVDTVHIKHTYAVDDGMFVVSCVLPPSSVKGESDIKIVIPATHSPADLGTSNDVRKLGIAINEIRFGKPESGFTTLLKRLRLYRK